LRPTAAASLTPNLAASGSTSISPPASLIFFQIDVPYQPTEPWSRFSMSLPIVSAKVQTTEKASA
jgi:hypothetical protein